MSFATPGPDWGMLLEEGGEIDGDPAKPRWVVDPLDGTSNFLHGIPHFAISIAVQEPKPGGRGWGEISHGLVYQPITDESFWAEKGRGAWLQDRRLRVSARRDLADALIATGMPFKGHGDLDALQQDPRRGRPRSRRHPPVRLGRARSRLGRGGPLSTASGRRISSSGTSRRASILVREAGGFVDRFPRRRTPGIAKGQVLAANDQLHSRLHKLVAGALR